MDNIAMLHELSKDKRFEIIFKNKKVYKDVVHKLNVISSSDKLYEYCVSYFRGQNDVLRYVELVKRLAFVQLSKLPNESNTLKDRALEIEHPEQLLIEDAEEFYQTLDNITDNKYDFLAKIKEKIAEVNFSSNIVRSCVGITETNGEKKVYINVSTNPSLNNRTALIHELWHYLSAKYFDLKATVNPDIIRARFPNKLREGYMIASKIAKGETVSDIIKPDNDEFYDDQFIDEIGTMFMEKVAKQFLVSKYRNNPEFCDGIKFLDKKLEYQNIIRAQNAYFDQLICIGVAGTSPKIREFANHEIMENLGDVWKSSDFYSKLIQLSDAVEGKTTFVPLLEFRYVIGEVISEEMYKKFAEGFYHQDKVKGKQIMSDVIEKIATINTNLNTIYKLKDKNSEAKNQVDIITEYLGIDKIEVLLDNLIKKLEDNYGVKKDYSFIDDIL